MAIQWDRLIKVSDEDTVNVIAGKQILFVKSVDGRGIVDIEKTGEEGLVDTYTIYYNDGTTSTFQVTNGSGGIESVVLVKDNDYEIVYNINSQDETYPLTISKMIDANVDSVYSRFAVKDSSTPRKEFHYFKASAEEHALGELDLVVNFPVTQLGSGTPSLTNIRPFYHVSEFEMFSSNKINLLSGVDKAGGQTPFTIAVLNNKTVRVTASSGAQEYYKADAFRYKMVLPAGEYAFSGGSYIPTGTSTVYASARIIDAGADSLLATDIGDGCTFTLYEDTLIHVLIDLGYAGASEVYTNFVLSPYLRNTSSSDEYSAPMGTYYKGDIAASGTEFWAYGGLYGGYIDIVGQKIYKTWDYIMSFDPETDADKLVGVWYSDRDEYGPGRIPTEGAEVVYCMEEPEVIGGIWGSLSCWINAQTSFCFRFAGAHGAFPAESYLSRRIVPMTLRQFIEMHKDIEISSVEQTKDNDYRESYKISESNGDSFDFDVSKMIDVNEDSPYDREGLWQASPWAQFYYCKVRSDGAGTLAEGDMIIKVPVHQEASATPGIRPFTGLTAVEFFHSHVINLLSSVDASGLPSAWGIGTGSNGGFIVTYSGAVPSNTRLDAFRYKMVLPAGEYKLSGGAYHNEWATPTVFLKNRVYDAIRDEVIATDEGDGCEFALYEDTLIIVKVDFYEASSSGFPYGTVFYPFLRKTTSGDTYAAPKGEYIKSSEISGGFYGGYIDLATGWMYREYGHIASYTEADASKLVGMWYSDRDEYEKGKLPTVGAEVVYHLEEPQADILGGFYGRDPMQLTDGETNFFGFKFQYGQYGVCDIEIAKRRIIPMTLRQYIQTHITRDVADFLYAERKHTHDDRYYRKSYLDMALSGKADAITKTGTMEDSGNPIVLPAGVTVTGAKLKFTLTQTGSGTPSASNIRPFLYALNLVFYVNDEDGEHLENMEYWLPYISPTRPVLLVDGEYDLIAGTLTTEYMAIQNWDGSTPIEAPWWSDRDEYASGTLPSVGAFVVYKLSEPQTYTAVANPELAQLWNQITEWEVIPKQRTADVEGFGEVEVGYSGQIQIPLEQFIEGITAEGFSTSKAYAVGDYVIYEGGLYRFTSAHSAGAWNSAEVAQTTITADKASTDDLGDMAFIDDAPSDGKTYGRKNGFWREVSGGGGGGGSDPVWGDISGTLSNQSDLQAALDAKADSSDLGDLAMKDTVDWDTDIDDIPSAFPPEAHTHDDRYYTETEVDTKLSGKADSADLGDLASKDKVSWNSDITGVPTTFPPSSHNHDDRYYTESEMDTKLAAKANTADLGTMAAIDDAPSTGSEYVRKNGQWAVSSGGGGGGGAAWGQITGSISDQTDLAGALADKADASDLGDLASKDSVAWATDITGIPSAFPPSSHTHDDRYYTESEMDTKLGAKADTADLGDLAGKDSVDWDTDITNIPAAFPPSTHTHDDRYYTETEVDTALSGKANASHTHDDRYYTESEVDTKLSGKANTADLGDLAAKDTVDWDTDIDDIPSAFPPSAHTHDDRYYTESEVDTALSGKADTADLGDLAGKDTVDYTTEVTNKPTLGDLAAQNSIDYTGNQLTNKPTLGGIQVRPDYTISTTDLTDGSSALETGKLYFYYEA